MKKTICLVALVLVGQIALRAQLKVDSTGNVGIHLADTVSPGSFLSIGGAGDNEKIVTVEQKDINFTITRTGILSTMTPSALSSSQYCTALCGNSYVSSTGGKILAIRAHAISSSNSSGRSCGIYGMAGGATSGWNFGVIGTISSTTTGYAAGIYGSLNAYVSSVPGKYAGYFQGQTKVNGDFYASTINTTSDARLKENVASVKNETLQKVNELRPIQFNWKPVEEKLVGDTVTAKTLVMSDDTNYERLHYGLVAQEVQSLFPELVHEDGAGYLSVNYVELIPILIQAVQTLSKEIDALKNGNTQRTISSLKSSRQNLMEKETEAVLYQNTPNPFTSDTQIEYTLPQNTKSANLYIYDMSGLQVQSYPLEVIGNGSIVVSAGLLKAGTYFYTLVVDNSVIDTKRMILTE